MSTSNTFGDKATIAAAPTPSTMMDSYWKGKIRCSVDHIATSATTMDSGSTISMCLTPKGAFIVLITAVYGAMSNAVTANLGDGTTAARWGALTTMASAGKQVVPSSDPLTALTADSYVVVTLGGANCGAAIDFYLMTYFLVN